MILTFIIIFFGSLIGSIAGFWFVFKTWRFPRIVVLSPEDVARMKAKDATVLEKTIGHSQNQKMKIMAHKGLTGAKESVEKMNLLELREVCREVTFDGAVFVSCPCMSDSDGIDPNCFGGCYHHAKRIEALRRIKDLTGQIPCRCGNNMPCGCERGPLDMPEFKNANT